MKVMSCKSAVRCDGALCQHLAAGVSGVSSGEWLGGRGQIKLINVTSCDV